MRTMGVWLLAVVFFFGLTLTPRAGHAYTPPPIRGALTDTSGKLSAEARSTLESRLVAYRNRTTNEIAVFVLDSLGGDTVEDVAYKAFNTWGIGQKGKDNGVLLVIAVRDRRMRIETGKGIGDKLTDLESSRILRERIGPFLKQERYFDAINAGLDAIEAALDSRPAPPMPDFGPKASPSTATTKADPSPEQLQRWAEDAKRRSEMEERIRQRVAEKSRRNMLISGGLVAVFFGVPILLAIYFSIRRKSGTSDGGWGTSSTSSSSDAGWSSSSSSSSSSFSSDSSSSSSHSSYSGGRGSSGGGGASDSW